jgi:hypothetical protein
MVVDFVLQFIEVTGFVKTLISSANNTVLESVFMPRGRSLIYIVNNTGPKI